MILVLALVMMRLELLEMEAGGDGDNCAISDSGALGDSGGGVGDFIGEVLSDICGVADGFDGVGDSGGGGNGGGGGGMLVQTGNS